MPRSPLQEGNGVRNAGDVIAAPEVTTVSAGQSHAVPALGHFLVWVLLGPVAPQVEWVDSPDRELESVDVLALPVDETAAVGAERPVRAFRRGVVLQRRRRGRCPLERRGGRDTVEDEEQA